MKVDEHGFQGKLLAYMTFKMMPEAIGAVVSFNLDVNTHNILGEYLNELNLDINIWGSFSEYSPYSNIAAGGGGY